MQAIAIYKYYVNLKYTIICVLCCMYYSNVAAQKISANIDRNKILIGEQITLQLKAEQIDLTKYTLEKWFVLSDTFNHFEVVQKNRIDTIGVGSKTDFIQIIQLTSFDSGYWQMPQFEIQLQDIATGIVTPFSTNVLQVAVLPVDVTSLKDYHDIKTIETVTIAKDWRWLIVAVVGAVVLFFLILWLLSKKKKIKPIAVNNTPTHTWALSEIEKLVDKKLVEQEQYPLFYTELILICKSFSDATLKINSTATTVDEYMLQLKGRVGNETIQLQYFQLLRLSNAVKFAKYIPAPNNNQDAVETAKAFIKTLHQFQFKP